MRQLLKFSAACLLLGLLTACHQEPTTGAAEVKWDRDTCARCSMALSDRRFAAQVRGGPKQRVFKFDDIGCAVFWLKDQPWAGDASTEIWVRDLRSEMWLEARSAYYVANKSTPMGYGYGAVVAQEAGAVNFEEARKRILAQGR